MVKLLRAPMPMYGAIILLVVFGVIWYLAGFHEGVAAGHRDLRCGLGTIAVPRPEPAAGLECLPLEVR